MRKIGKAQAIGCVVGTVEGLMPGGGGSIASFFSYNEAKRWSRYREEFGKGSVEGDRRARDRQQHGGQHGADPAALASAFPGSNSAAILLGGLLIHGLLPGPRLFEQNGDVILGLYVGSFVAITRPDRRRHRHPAALHVAGEPPAALSRRLHLRVRRVGHLHDQLAACGTSASFFAVGFVGYLMRLAGFPFLPAVLGVVLGPLVESNYRRSLLLSGGDHAIFLEDPIAIGFLVTAAVFVIWSLVREVRDSQSDARKEATP